MILAMYVKNWHPDVGLTKIAMPKYQLNIHPRGASIKSLSQTSHITTIQILS